MHLNASPPNFVKNSIVLISIILSIFIINFISFRADHNWGGDFALYVAQAISLGDGTIDDLIKTSLFRYEHSEDSILLSPKLYPWGYPIILAPIYHFYGIDMVALKLFTNIFFLLTLPIIYLTFKDRITGVQNFILVALIAYNPYFFDFKEEIRSDLPFLFFSVLSIYLIQLFIIQKKYLVNNIVSLIMLGIAIFISFSIRGNGILLLPSLFLVQIVEYGGQLNTLRKNYSKVLSSLIPYFTFFIFMKIIHMALPSGESTYADMYHYITLAGISENAIYYSKLLSRFFSTILQKPGFFLYLVSLPFFFVGLAGRLKQDYLYTAFMVLTLGLYIVYPGKQGLRFIFPVIPYFLYFIITGIGLIEHKLSNGKGAILASVVVGASILFLFISTITVTIYKQYTDYKTVDGPYRKESIELFDYIKKNTPKDSIIIFFKPRVLTLYTQRNSARIINYEKAVQSGADYAVCKKSSTLNLQLRGHKADTVKVFSNGEFIMYRLIFHK
jgi:hypothetical protein